MRYFDSVDHAILMQMTLTIELEQAADGRWLAEIPELPGVMVYGESQAKAAQRARASIPRAR